MSSHEQLARQILHEQVRRNARRFPQEFSFILSNQEAAILKSHLATSSWGGKRRPPRVFTEHDQLERQVGSHDRAILEVLQALRQLTQPAEAPKRRRIGFVQD